MGSKLFVKCFMKNVKLNVRVVLLMEILNFRVLWKINVCIYTIFTHTHTHLCTPSIVCIIPILTLQPFPIRTFFPLASRAYFSEINFLIKNYESSILSIPVIIHGMFHIIHVVAIYRYIISCT